MSMSARALENEFSEDDFQSIESAVRETAKGRWFLDEIVRRNKSENTGALIQAIHRIERNINRPILDADWPQAELNAMKNALQATARDIANVRNDMLDDADQPKPSGDGIFRDLAMHVRADARDIISTAESLQASVEGLKDAGAPEIHVSAIEERVDNLFVQGWRHDILRQRVAMVMGLLEHFENRLTALTEYQDDTGEIDEASPAPALKAESEPQEQQPVAAVSEKNLPFFADDEYLFDDGDARPAGTADAAAAAKTDEVRTEQPGPEATEPQSAAEDSAGDAATEQTPEAAAGTDEAPAAPIEKTAADVTAETADTADTTHETPMSAPRQCDEILGQTLNKHDHGASDDEPVAQSGRIVVIRQDASALNGIPLFSEEETHKDTSSADQPAEAERNDDKEKQAGQDVSA